MSFPMALFSFVRQYIFWVYTLQLSINGGKITDNKYLLYKKNYIIAIVKIKSQNKLMNLGCILP